MVSVPPLPSLRALTRELRELHAAWNCADASGGDAVCLALISDEHGEVPGWRVMPCDNVASIHRSVLADTAHAPIEIPGSVERACPTCDNEPDGPWDCDNCKSTGRVHVPSPFDATAAARRLLAAARDVMLTHTEKDK
jgi:hypothetical protein